MDQDTTSLASAPTDKASISSPTDDQSPPPSQLSNLWKPRASSQTSSLSNPTNPFFSSIPTSHPKFSPLTLPKSTLSKNHFPRNPPPNTSPSKNKLPLGRAQWSLKLQEERMPQPLGARQAADEEARAELDLLNSRLEKTTQLNRKIAASLQRLNESGRTLDEAVGPIYSTTSRLQVLGNNIDGVLAAIERIRQPSDIKSNEEDIIRKGPEKAGLAPFLSSVKRLSKALAELQQTNLRSNQQAVADLHRLLKSGNTQLESYFQKLLQEDSRPVEPLHYLTKDKPFPMLSQDKMTRLGLINSYIATTSRQTGAAESPMLQSYASVRGPYLTATLQNLAAASLNTANKKTDNAMYQLGMNGIDMYGKGMEGAFLAEYDNICALFSRDEWGKAFNLTCQGAISELGRALRELNSHIKNNVTTDCFLAYEIIEVVSNLSSNLDSRTGELKPSFAAALKPIRETGKWSLGALLEDTRRKISEMQVFPGNGAVLPITTETMSRLIAMVNFLRPISSIMVSIGDGGWKTNSANNVSMDQIPSLKSFDIGADGKQIFAHYCVDTVDTLLNTLQEKGKPLIKGKPTLGVFITNNATVVDRMIRTSDLKPLLASRMSDIDKWRKTGAQLYTMAWREPSTHLLDVQYTNRGARPPSGSANSIDSASIIKGLNSKDKDAIKEKFRLFNTSFDELVSKHKGMQMEPEVREMFGRQIQQMIEPLYGRFWDRYHEVDKGKGKYVKYDKGSISGVFLSLT